MPAAASAASAPFRRTRLTQYIFRARQFRRARIFRISLALIGALPFAWTPPAVAAQEQAPRSSVASEIRSAMPGKLRDFYAPRGYWPLWIEGNAPGPQAGALIDLIENADRDRLDPRDYDPRGLRRLVQDASQSGDPKMLAKAELALSKAFGALVSDMRKPSRAVQMRYLDAELEPRPLDPSDVLRAAALAPSLTEYVRSAGWMSPVYLRLRDVRASYDATWGGLPAVTVPEGVRFRPGMKGGDLPILRHRLGLPDGIVYDKALVAQVKAFQDAHGLKPDGVAGPQSVAALNQGPGFYDRLLTLNLERARLLPGPWVRHVVVDAASARLTYYSGGSIDGTMKVVVGAKESQTPMMAGMIRYATLNPYWNIPPDLVERKVAPKVLGGASLARMNYEALSDWSANPAKLDASTIDWRAVANGQRELRVRQLPGGDNAMGKVKFMFPNDLGIYLHDTPARDLFAKPARQYSNGCVRLEDAQRLGRWFFGKQLTPESGVPEQHQPLPQPVPVYLTYLTAVPEGDGVRFLPDVYDRDGVF